MMNNTKLQALYPKNQEKEEHYTKHQRFKANTTKRPHGLSKKIMDNESSTEPGILHTYMYIYGSLYEYIHAQKRHIIHPYITLPQWFITNIEHYATFLHHKSSLPKPE